MNNLIFRVVPDYAIKCEVILGRDAIKVLDFILNKRRKEKCESVTHEILSIEPSAIHGNVTKNLKINPDEATFVIDLCKYVFHGLSALGTTDRGEY